MAADRHEGAVTRDFFDRSSSWWRDIYSQDSLEGVIYREREQQVLTWVDELGLAAGASAMDVGCGAGRLAAALAQRGLTVDAVDVSAAMVDEAKVHVSELELTDRVRVQVAESEHLPGASGAFDLVVAVGLLPWVPSPPRAVAECARLLRPGGTMIVTADNAARIGVLGSPTAHPMLAPLRRAKRAWRRRREKGVGAEWQMHTSRQVDAMVAGSGLRIHRRTTLGFGPFMVRGRATMSAERGLRLHRSLSTLAQHRLPILRRLGWHYLVLAERPRPAARSVDPKLDADQLESRSEA